MPRLYNFGVHYVYMGDLMKRTEVESSMIRSVGYDLDARILEIEFNSGQVYQYFDVPLEEYEGLMKAESHGRYFLANIRDVYSYGRVGRARRLYR